jgi:antibiotic biosynthesis monooxygenase (ABM) superfamily enzyme
MLLIASNLIAKHVGTLIMFAIVIASAVAVGLLTHFAVVPLLRKWIDGYLPSPSVRFHMLQLSLSPDS